MNPYILRKKREKKMLGKQMESTGTAIDSYLTRSTPIGGITPFGPGRSVYPVFNNANATSAETILNQTMQAVSGGITTPTILNAIVGDQVKYEAQAQTTPAGGPSQTAPDPIVKQEETIQAPIQSVINNATNAAHINTTETPATNTSKPIKGKAGGKRNSTTAQKDNPVLTTEPVTSEKASGGSKWYESDKSQKRGKTNAVVEEDKRTYAQKEYDNMNKASINTVLNTVYNAAGALGMGLVAGGIAGVLTRPNRNVGVYDTRAGFWTGVTTALGTLAGNVYVNQLESNPAVNTPSIQIEHKDDDAVDTQVGKGYLEQANEFIHNKASLYGSQSAWNMGGAIGVGTGLGMLFASKAHAAGRGLFGRSFAGATGLTTGFLLGSELFAHLRVTQPQTSEQMEETSKRVMESNDTTIPSGEKSIEAQIPIRSAQDAIDNAVVGSLINESANRHIAAKKKYVDDYLSSRNNSVLVDKDPEYYRLLQFQNSSLEGKVMNAGYKDFPGMVMALVNSFMDRAQAEGMNIAQAGETIRNQLYMSLNDTARALPILKAAIYDPQLRQSLLKQAALEIQMSQADPETLELKSRGLPSGEQLNGIVDALANRYIQNKKAMYSGVVDMFSNAAKWFVTSKTDSFSGPLERTLKWSYLASSMAILLREYIDTMSDMVIRTDNLGRQVGINQMYMENNAWLPNTYNKEARDRITAITNAVRGFGQQFVDRGLYTDELIFAQLHKDWSAFQKSIDKVYSNSVSNWGLFDQPVVVTTDAFGKSVNQGMTVLGSLLDVVEASKNFTPEYSGAKLQMMFDKDTVLPKWSQEYAVTESELYRAVNQTGQPERVSAMISKYQGDINRTDPITNSYGYRYDEAAARAKLMKEMGQTQQPPANTSITSNNTSNNSGRGNMTRIVPTLPDNTTAPTNMSDKFNNSGVVNVTDAPRPQMPTSYYADL